MAQTEASNGEAGGYHSGDEFVTTVLHQENPRVEESTSSCEYVTAGMSEAQIQAAIDTSREQGWSELAHSNCQDGNVEDALIWEELKKSYPHVFKELIEDGFELELGRLIAEGGQAHIYEAKLGNVIEKKWYEEVYVAKVFKMEGFSLADLLRQWPRATKAPHLDEIIWKHDFVLGGVVFGEHMLSCSYIHWGTFLEDGRFAFLMRRYWGDLRSFINLKLKNNNFQGPPFLHSEALMIMKEVAWGMRALHARGVLHRDLKAANVLISGNIGRNPRSYWCRVADYESGALVQGTQFWRAPEVLEALLKKKSDQHLEIWTEKVDAYSYAMTCYEIITGHILFDGYVKSDWKRVIDGERPHLPEYVDPRLGELVERCWHKEPSERPTFKFIAAELEGHVM